MRDSIPEVEQHMRVPKTVSTLDAVRMLIADETEFCQHAVCQFPESENCTCGVAAKKIIALIREETIEECCKLLPGGYSVDPQKLADDFRALKAKE